MLRPTLGPGVTGTKGKNGRKNIATFGDLRRL